MSLQYFLTTLSGSVFQRVGATTENDLDLTLVLNLGIKRR